MVRTTCYYQFWDPRCFSIRWKMPCHPIQIELTSPFHLCTVYVPPNSDLSYLESVIDFFTINILSSCIPCIIVGDFNLPNICWSSLTGSSAMGASFCEFVFNWNLTQHVSVPTHIKGNILDLVLTSDNIQISDLSFNHPGSIINSDHFLISFDLHCEGPQSVVNKTRYVLDYIQRQIGMVSVLTFMILILACAFSPMTLNLFGVQSNQSSTKLCLDTFRKSSSILIVIPHGLILVFDIT